MEHRETELFPALSVQRCNPDIVMTSGAANDQIMGKKSILRIAQIKNKMVVALGSIENEKEILSAERAFDSRATFLLRIGALASFQKQRRIVIRKEDCCVDPFM